MKKHTHTRGNVIVEDINVGDIHYEFGYNMGIRVEVLTKPVRHNDGTWTWKSKIISTGELVDYAVSEGFAHYAPNLYDYEAYNVKQIL